MKNLLLPIVLLLSCLAVPGQAQSPQAIHYQAIARDGAGKPMANEKDISIEFSVLDGSVTGQPVYVERHLVDANQFGLFFAEIGRGTPVSGSFSAIDWAGGAKFLKVDINGNLQGTTQMLAVPYALYAAAAPEKQVLSISGNSLSLSPGNTVSLPGGTGGDDWGNQTVQADPVFSGNGTVAAPLGLASQNASPGQVLKWDGTKWTPQNDIGGGTGDNWGSQTAKTDATLSGEGTSASPLKIAPQNAANGQFLQWNGSTWLPADVIGDHWGNQKIEHGVEFQGNGTVASKLELAKQGALDKQALVWFNSTSTWQPETVDLSNTNEIQVLSLNSGGDSLLLSNGGGKVKLSGGAAGWGLVGNSGTDPATNFMGTTDDQPVSFRVFNIERMKLDKNGRLDIYGTNGNVMVGEEAGQANTTGASNSFFGRQAGFNNLDGSQNSFFGKEAGKANTSGSRNTAIGDNALLSNMTGGDNLAAGKSALRGNITGFSNTAIGTDALLANTTGSENIAIGKSALLANMAGSRNVSVGRSSLASNTGGNGNVAVGHYALFSNTTRSNLVAVGDSALFSNTGILNTAVGSTSLSKNTSGHSNTATGSASLSRNTTGNYNTAMGEASLTQNTTGSQNAAFGDNSLFSNMTGNFNTATGAGALSSNTSGSGNVAVGVHALFNNTTSSNLVAVGDSALFRNTSGARCTAVGSKALWQNTTGYENTANGFESLYSNTTGYFNTANGFYSLKDNVTGSFNTANGAAALHVNTTGSLNTAIGADALASNTTGNSNVALGYRTLYRNITSSNLVAVGDSALYSNTSGKFNTAVGSKALFENTTGSWNTAYGQKTLFDNATGNFNTAIGAFSGPIGATFLAGTITLGYNTVATASNSARIGSSGTNSIGGQVNWTALSDQRIKTQIQENIPGLNFIKKLRPVTYRYDIHRQNALLGLADTAQWEGKYDIEKMTFSGFLAQEVEQAARSVGYDFSGVDAPKNDKSLYGLRYAEFVVPLVKAVQEQQAIIEAQRAELLAQGRVLEGVLARLAALEAAAGANR